MLSYSPKNKSVMITPWCIITMLHTISIIAQKGGSGKTTLALTLAVAVEQASRTAVVLDIDSQATACKWSARRAADTPLVLAVQPARLPDALTTTAAHDVDVVVIDTPARSGARGAGSRSCRRSGRHPLPPATLRPRNGPGDAAGLVACGRRVRRRCAVGGGRTRPTDRPSPHRTDKLWASRLPRHAWLPGRRW